MSESTVKLTLEAGDILTQKGGGFAEVLSVEYDKDSKKPVVIGYNMHICEPGKDDRNALIQLAHLPGFMSRWHIDGEPLAEPSAIDPELTATATVIADLREQVKQLRERNTHLEDRNAELTAQLAEARLASAPIQPTPAADHTVAPKQEVYVARDVAGHYIAEKLNSGWAIQFMQFIDSGGAENEDRLNVVFIRFVTPTPVAPKPVAKVTVQPLGSTVTIIPEAVKSPRRFNAEEYMAEVLESANRAAMDVVNDTLPAYQAILNPRPLALGVSNPVKPEVRNG